MTPTETELREARELIDRAMQMSPIARESIAFELLDSLHGPPEDPEEVRQAWQAETARRVEEIETGRVRLLGAKESLARIEQELQERRGR